MAEFTGFPPELLVFLSELALHNNREWFEANKERYVRFAREPTLAFIAHMKDRLADISPSYVADPRPNGGSMFRIYRDTRFAKDKTPYKVNVGCQFRHSAGRNAHAPGFYLHIQPGESFAGGGIWMPPVAVLDKIRTAIHNRQEEWGRIKEFLRKSPNVSFMDAERYKRPPQGYAADHPFIDDLKLKTIYAGRSFTDDEVISDEFVISLVRAYEDLAPFMRFINEALGLSF